MFYRAQALAYAEATRAVDTTPLRTRLLDHVPPAGHILDAGCGSGRDALAFANLGFKVTAFDASPELAALARQHTGLTVQVAEFLKLDGPESLGLPPDTRFDAIWTCASLLHVPEREQPGAWHRLWALLKPGGVIYASYKVGMGQRTDEHGRHFTDADEGRLNQWLQTVAGVAHIECWRSLDARPDSGQTWLNVLVHRQASAHANQQSGHPSGL